jgi:hypothetical protein
VPGAESPVYYHPCPVKGGSSYIFDVDLSSGRLTYARPVSDTDDPASPFYTLNARDYVENRYRAFPVTDAEVAADATSTETLTVP